MIDPNLPIDKIAALVVHKPKEQTRDFRRIEGYISSMSPLPLGVFNGIKEHDLTGVKYGRLTVIGFALFRPNNWKTSTNSARWVVKCSCGRYEIRTTKSIKKAYTQSARCRECQLNYTYEKA